MGCVLKKRGNLGSPVFRGKRGNILHEILFIIGQFVIVLMISIALLAYTNNVATDLGFEKRFSSIDLALIATTVFYAPGTLKVEHRPIAFEVPMVATFKDSEVHIEEPGSKLAPLAYWHLSDNDMDMFSDSASIRATLLTDDDDREYFRPVNLTFYKAGRQVSLSESGTHPFQMICPSINTSMTDWQSQKIFIPRVLPSADDYKDETRTENRVAGVFGARYSQQTITDMSASSSSVGSSQVVSGIPEDADVIVALGDAGEDREPGGLVLYVSANHSVIKSRKLACLIANQLLVPKSVVFYVQIMPVFTESLESNSPLNVFKELSSDDQVMVFLDISGFAPNQVDVTAIADAIHNAIGIYYGEINVPRVGGVPLMFRSSALAQGTDDIGGIVGGIGAGDSPSPGAPAGNLDGVGGTPSLRMLSVCNGNKNFENLKAVTKLWVEEGMHDGAVYVRGGKTASDGVCSNHADPDWIKKNLGNRFGITEFPDSSDALRVMYDEYIVSKLSGTYFCADCASFVHQLYECGLGRGNPRTAPVIAATPGAITSYDDYGRPKTDGPSWNVPGENCWDSVVLPQLNGQLQFGDIIQMPGHFVMYAGGAGLDYDIVEMGAGSFGGNKERAQITLALGNGNPMSGLRTTDSVESALKGLTNGCIIKRVDAPNTNLMP